MAEINPHQAPSAPVLDRHGPAGSLASEPNTVDVGRGLTWLSEGWNLFKQAPLVWIAICVLAMIAYAVLAFIPVVGQLAAMLLSFLFAGGIMLGCRALNRGEDLTINHLFAGAQRHLAPLLTIAALYLAGIFLAVLLIGLMTGGTLISVLGGGVQPGVAFMAILTFLVVAAVVLVPLGMAIWFAPTLITLHDIAPIPAMKSSFNGCLRNWLAFIVYGVIVFVLMVIASIPFMLGWLVLLPVVAGSVYAGYKDIFLQP